MSSQTIKSVSDSQTTILNNIMELCAIQRFDADITYGNGAFYKNGRVPSPAWSGDVQPLSAEVHKCSSNALPFQDATIHSAIFDPPFLTYIKQGRNHSSVMAKRFGGYWAYSELEEHYSSTLSEVGRVMAPKGVLVVKCQDIIHNHKMHPTHISVVKWAEPWFRLKDLFILAARHRMPMPVPGRQQHARIYHSYFLVLERARGIRQL